MYVISKAGGIAINRHISASSRKCLRHIQTNINKLRHVSDKQIADHFGKNRHYISDVYRSYSPNSIKHVLSSQGISYKTLFYAIDTDNTMKLKKWLSRYRQRVMNMYTPVHKLMTKRHKSVSDMAKMLHISYQESFIHTKSSHMSLRVIRRYSKVFHVPFKRLALQYGHSQKAIQRVLRDPYDKIHIKLKKLRKKHHWSQKYVAAQLHIRQTAVSGLEHQAQPTLPDIISLSHLYNIKPIELLHICPKYKGIQLSSPSYKLICLAVSANVSPREVARLSGIHRVTINYFLLKKIKQTDRIPLIDVNRLCFAFNLDSNYFGPAEDRIIEGFVKYAKNSGMTPDMFGYRYNKLRCQQHLTYESIGKIMGVSTERAESYSKLIHPSKYVFNKILNLFPTKYQYLAGSVYPKYSKVSN